MQEGDIHKVTHFFKMARNKGVVWQEEDVENVFDYAKRKRTCSFFVL